MICEPISRMESEEKNMGISEQFSGLPMRDLIGSPLAAAADASINLANSTADFINRVGFDKDGNVRNVAFKYEKISKNEDGTLNLDAMKVDVPMLAIVPIPNLQVDEVNVLFDMEVKQSERSEKAFDLSAAASAKLDLGLFSVNVSGSVSVHQNNTRSSDNSAKYHVDVRAANHGTPEGLARVLDMMAANVAPSLIGSTLKDENGQDLVGDAKVKAERRKKLMNERNALERRISAARDALDTSITEMKRNMDEQMSQYRIAITRNMSGNFTDLENEIKKLEEDMKKEQNETKKKELEERLNAKKDELKNAKSSNSDKYNNVLEEMNQKWAGAQTMLVQNIRDIASLETYDDTKVSAILGLSGLSTDGVTVTEYVKADNAGKYDAILLSQKNAVKKQQDLNKLEGEYIKKKEEYDDAFRN